MTAGEGSNLAPGEQFINLDFLNELAERRQSEAPRKYTCPHTGMVVLFRPINGQQRNEARQLSFRKDNTIDLDKFEFGVVNRASVQPTKVSQAMWAALGKLDNAIREGLSDAIHEASGLTQSAKEDALKGSTPTEESDDSGTA